MDEKTKQTLPLGFGMALAQHPQALSSFGRMDAAGQAQVVQRARQVQNRQEMEQIIASLETK
ncbi:MAG: hypothetical protein ACI3VX_00890 [Faecousia sp.]